MKEKLACALKSPALILGIARFYLQFSPYKIKKKYEEKYILIITIFWDTTDYNYLQWLSSETLSALFKCKSNPAMSLDENVKTKRI